MSDPIPESDIDKGGAARDSQRLQKVHDRAMRRFDSVAKPQQELRAQSLAARRFVTIPGAQWEGPWGIQFENAPRPEVDLITRSLEKIETDYRENRLLVDFVSVDDDTETADTLDGMYLADSQQYKAQQARDNALQEGIRGGMGAWRVTTDYADPYDPNNDAQRVNPGVTIVDADQSVYWDIGSILYDKSDAKWAFIVTADPRAEAVEKWGDKIADWPLQQWKLAYDWYTPDIVRKAEYYEVEDVPDILLILKQEQSGAEMRFFGTEIEEGALKDLKAQGWKQTERAVKRVRVHKYILNGSYVLKDCGYIAGPNIPIVPFYGRREYVDNMERWRGHVHKKMDAQRIFNGRLARLTEIDSLSPREIPIVLDEQLTPQIMEEWRRQNIDRHPFARLKALRDENGAIVAAGPIGKVEPPQIPPVTGQLLQFTGQMLSADDDTADQVKANVSADAMDIAANRVDAKSAIYLDNMRQSIIREGEIWLGMAREVYYEPGRQVDTLTLDGQNGKAELHEPVMDNGVYKIRNDLSQGKFKVAVDVAESTATKRQKAVRQFEGLAAAFGPGTPENRIMLLNAVRQMDGESISELQDWARKQLVGQGVIKPTPEEAQQLQEEQANQPPDPSAIALQSAAQQAQSQAILNQSKAKQQEADAALKMAQAEELSKAPAVPTGLSSTPANDYADAVDKVAGANLKQAQAAHLQEQMHHQRIRTGADLAQEEHQREMDRRAADLADRQARQGGE